MKLVKTLAVVLGAALAFACGGSSTSDGGGGSAATGGAATGGSGGNGATAGSGASAANGGSGGGVPCTSFVPCCDAAGNSVDPYCDASGNPQCPSGSAFPPSGVCSGTSTSCTPQQPCGVKQYCDYPDDLCGAGAPGTCKNRPTGCDLTYDPVCTCAGELTGNACAANSGGQDVGAGGCAPPQGTFTCGTAFCDVASQYCLLSVSDVGGIPNSYDCLPLPAGCTSPVSCSCLELVPCGMWCSVNDQGHVTLTCPGG